MEISKNVAVSNYNKKMEGMDKKDATVGSYSWVCKSYKQTTKAFFHLIEKIIFNPLISYKKCDGKKRFLQFKLNLIQFILREAPVDAGIAEAGYNKHEGCQNLQLIPWQKSRTSRRSNV